VVCARLFLVSKGVKKVSSQESIELAQEYADGLRPIRALYSYFKTRRDNCLSLVKECENAQQWDLSFEFKGMYEEYRERAKELSSVISSSQYSIQWLRTGFEPQSGGTAKLPNIYKEVRVSDVDQALTYLNLLKTEYQEMTEDQLIELDAFLNTLSPREKETFVSIRGKGNTYEETAAYLGVTKSAVQTYLKRAEKKVWRHVKEGVQTSLF